MKLKKITALILAFAMALALAACGGGSQGGDANADSSAAGTAAPSGGSSSGKGLEVAIWENNQVNGLQEIADEWTAESGVKVKINVVDWNNYWTLLEAGAAGGELPDVFWMHSNTAQMYMENDMLLPLDDYIANDDAIDLNNYYDGIVKLYNSNGVQYAIPKDHDTIALLYNEPMFEKYNVETPTDDWSWDDVYEAAAKITEAGAANDDYGIAFDTGNNQDGWYNIVEGYGGKIITDDHKGTTIGGPEAKAGMEMVRKLLTVGTPQPVVSQTGSNSLFQSGKVAMVTQGSWMISQFYQADRHEDYKWAMLPYADANGNGQCDEGERVSCYNGLGWAIDAKTDMPDEAYSLISYFCSEKGQIEQAEKGVTLAGYVGLSDAFNNAFDGMDVSAFTKIEEEGTLFFRPYTRNTTIWEDQLLKSGGFLDAWQNPEDPELMSAACDKAQQIIEDAIAAEQS